jgi:ParB family transcriptional regulator, chromosome partitioning protein
MAEETTRPRLGRGLAALIGDVDDEAGVVERSRGARRVPIEFLRPNPRNPRKRFSDEQLQELVGSIRQHGIVQPIVVRAIPNLPDGYEIVAGERRWRAAQQAGLHDVPIVVVDVDDRTSLEYAIVENVQRADLNPIEEAAGYERLIGEFHYTQADLAQILGRSRSHVANTIRLLALPQKVQAMVTDGRITAGHARALLAVKDPETVAQRVVDQDLTVRAVERLASADQGKSQGTSAAPKSRHAPPEKDPDTRALEQALEDVLGLVVAIEHRGQGGELRIRYKSLEQLDSLCRRLHEAAR